MDSSFDTKAAEWDDNPMKVKRAEQAAKLISEIQFASYSSIVDFGSGTGLLGMNLTNLFSEVHLVDSSRGMLNAAQSKIATAQINNVTTQQAESLSELQSKHSAIATLMTLHHIPDVTAFFREAYSVLDKSGTLIIADLYEEDGSFHKDEPAFDGHDGFNIEELSTIAESNGFAVQRVEQFYEILKKNYEGREVPYPLFFFVATKVGE